MTVESVNWMAGGPQGSGVDTASNIFGKACGYGGLCVFGRREFHSNIKTMHSYFTQRITKQPTLATLRDVDLLAAFDAETVVRHVGEVAEGGAVILDDRDLYVNFMEDIATFSEEYRAQLRTFLQENGIKGENVSDLTDWAKTKNIRIYPIPYLDLLKQVGAKLGIEKIGTLTKMINVLAVGVSCALLKYDRKLVEDALKATFPPKLEAMNLLVLEVAYDYAEKNCNIENFKHKLEKQPITEKRILLTGNQAVALGKVLGGCRVQTYYPITPAADESEYIEAHEILKTKGTQEAVIVIQTEDEIAAINSASGACLAGSAGSYKHFGSRFFAYG